MRRLMRGCVVLLFAQALGAQAPLKTIVVEGKFVTLDPGSRVKRGIGGGDSLGKLMSDSRSIGEDIAKFLAKWARGDNLE